MGMTHDFSDEVGTLQQLDNVVLKKTVPVVKESERSLDQEGYCKPFCLLGTIARHGRGREAVYCKLMAVTQKTLALFYNEKLDTMSRFEQHTRYKCHILKARTYSQQVEN